MEFTEEERNFIKNLLNQLSFRPAAEDAEKTVKLVRSILDKI